MFIHTPEAYARPMLPTTAVVSTGTSTCAASKAAAGFVPSARVAVAAMGGLIARNGAQGGGGAWSPTG